jgi:tetratricopeptide (TPR) repeat protein
MKKFVMLIFLGIFTATTLNVVAQSKTSAKNESSIAVKSIRDFYLKRDFEGGSELGKKLTEKYPDNIELKAWYVINLARSNYGEPSLDYAEKLVKEYGENVWTLLALTTANAYNKWDSSMAIGEKLVKLFPNDEEAIFAYKLTLFQNGKDKEAIEWLERNKSKIKDQSRYFTELGTSTYYVEQKKEKGEIKKAFELFSKGVKLNPNSLNANYQYASYLVLEKKMMKQFHF